MKAYIKETIDYTLKRKGDRIYTMVDENKQDILKGGAWKTRTACMKRLKELGYEYVGKVTVHENYSHWADFEPVC